nr:ribonuclease H-like domain-containing protein [Tanacetum cinerariifolium]
YLQNEHYALWEVIEFGDSYKAHLEETGKGPASESSTKKTGRTIVITTEDMQKRRNVVKARTTLLLSLPDEHQLRFNKFWKKTGKKITIQGSDVAGFDKSKVECFNCHKIGHFATECRAPRSQDRGKRESYKQGPKEEELAPKALVAIDGIGWDWSYMANEKENHALVADDEVPTKFALMAKSSSSLENEVYDDSYCSKSCRKNTENLNTKISKLNEQLSDCEIDLYHYKIGLSQVEARLVEFKEQEIKFYEKIRGLERDVEVRNNKIEYLINELEQVKKEKEGLDNKLTSFESASKDLDNLLRSQRSDKNKEGLGYNTVPPPPAQVYSPPKKDLSWTSLPKFVDDTVTDYSRLTPSIDTSKSNTSDLQSRKSAVRTQPRVPRVSTVTKIFPTIDSKFPTVKSTFTADLGNKGKDVKALACWIYRPKQNTTEKGLNYNGVSVTFKKYQYIDTQGRLKSHMTDNISYLSEYEPYDGGFVSFGHGGVCNFIMAKLAFCDYHNMIAILDKTKHNIDFHQIVDFLEASHIRIETMDLETKILAIVDGKPRTISESSLRRHLKLNDKEGISSLPDTELFKNLSLMGYNILLNQIFTFQKGQFSHQWKFLIHTIMQCLSPRSTGFNEFSSNIATVVVCLATNRVYNFSKMTFDGMVRNITNKGSKFLMYPRRYTRRAIQIAQSKALSPATDESASLLRDDRQGEDFPTVSSLDAGQDQENINKTSAFPYESSPRLLLLMVMRARKCRAYSRGCSNQRGIMETGKEVGADKSTELGSIDTDEMVNVLSSMEAVNILTSGVTVVSVSPVAGVSAAGVPTVSGSFPTVSVIFTIASVVTSYSRRPKGITIRGAQHMRSPIIGAKDKGKQKMVESEVPKKRKLL